MNTIVVSYYGYVHRIKYVLSGLKQHNLSFSDTDNISISENDKNVPFQPRQGVFYYAQMGKKPVDQGSFCPVKGQCILGIIQQGDNPGDCLGLCPDQVVGKH